MKRSGAMFLKASLATLISATCLVAAGCGDREAPADAAAGVVKKTAAQNAQRKGLDNDLVKAASPSKSGADVEMRFKLASRPEAGKPADLTLVFVPPAQDIDRMTVSLQASDGLTIESGEGPAIFVPSKGAPISHEMSVKSDRDGIYFVTASVLLDTMNNTTSSRSFSVPVIIGQGISAAPDAAGSAAPDAAGSAAPAAAAGKDTGGIRKPLPATTTAHKTK